ncbi:MAG: hypothetical protein ACI360_06610 [Atopobiaceae bacterium]
MAKTKKKVRRQKLSHDSQDAMLKEADAQTRAIMRLETYQRAAYSVVAIGVLLMLWGFVGSSDFGYGIAGIVCVILGVPAAAILHTGIDHGKKNVEKILKDYDIVHGRNTTEESAES